MGKRGPAKKPTNLALLHGDRKDRVNTSEPHPSTLDVTSPGWLSDQARQVWEHIAPDLETKGVLTAWDTEAFACWCDAVVRRRTAARNLREQGEVIEAPVFNKNGDVTGHRMTKSPWTLVLNEADAQVQRYGARFGLTPSDRADLHIGEAGSDPDADLLTG